MQKTKILSIVICLILCSCAPVRHSAAPDYSDVRITAPVKLNKTQITAVEKGVKSSLKDPDSAKFRGIIAGKTPKGSINVCGYVNARNSFGGYTGDKPFNGLLFSGKVFAVTGMGGTDIDSKVILEVCQNSGLSL